MKEKILQHAFFERIQEKVAQYLKKQPEIRMAEIFATGSKSMEIQIEEGFIKQARQRAQGGLGLRIIGEGGKEGLANTTDFSDNALEKVTDLGVKMMKAATPNPEFKDLAHPAKKYTHVNDLYDPIINEISLDDIQTSLGPLFNLKRRSRPPDALSGGLSPTVGACYIWNTNGINRWEISSSVGVEINVTLLQGKKVSYGTDSNISMNWRDLNVKKVADQAYKIAYQGLKKISVPTGRYSVLLTPKAVDGFFLDSITGAINAEAIQNHLSFLADFRKKEIASEKLSIIDDPFVAGRLGSASFDDEGIATRPITIVEKGVLNELYHNTFTAGKEGIPSNGHAARGSFAAPVRISPHNVLINPGNESWKEILAGIKNGILFDYTGDRPNAITGDFSGLIMTGYRIKDGKIGAALQENMIGINLIDAMKQIDAISREREWRGNACVPWIKLRDVAISGR